MTPWKDLRSADGTKIATFRWTPAGEPRGDVVLVHGLAEHVGRYEHIAKAFTDRGFRATMVELRGHGDSEGRRGHVDAWRHYVEDLEAVAAAVAAESGRRPAIVAHSMGSLVTLDWLRDHEAPAVVLSAPLLRPIVPQPRWKVTAAKVLHRLLPTLPIGNEIRPENVTRHPEVAAAYATDAKVFKTVTPRWFFQMNEAIARVVEHAPKYRTPALFMWGTGEKIVDPVAIAELSTRYGGPKDTREWPGLYHEIFNEPERDEVLAAATSWLEGRLQG